MFCSSYLLVDLSGVGLAQSFTGLFSRSSCCWTVLAANPTHVLTDMPTFRQSGGRIRYLPSSVSYPHFVGKFNNIYIKKITTIPSTGNSINSHSLKWHVNWWMYWRVCVYVCVFEGGGGGGGNISWIAWYQNMGHSLNAECRHALLLFINPWRVATGLIRFNVFNILMPVSIHDIDSVE